MRVRGKVTALMATCLAAIALTLPLWPDLIRANPTGATFSEITLSEKILGHTGKTYNLQVNTNDPYTEGVAALSLDTSNRHSIISSLQLPGNLENIHIDRDKDLAYLANSFSGLQIIDISDPSNLRILSSLSMPGNTWDITIQGNTLFMASLEEGLYLVDISSVEKPIVISQLKIKNHSILHLAVSNKTVYATTGNKGLLVINVANIKKPKLTKTLYSKVGAWGVLADKNKLYVSSGNHKLSILDISTPTHPRELGEVSLPSRVWDMAMHENILYIPARLSGLFFIDMNDPYTPELMETSFKIISPNRIDIQSGRAYISSRSGSLSIVDLTNPTAPKLNETFDIPHYPRNIAVSNQIAFIANGINGLQVFDTKTLKPANAVEKLHVPGSLVQILFNEDYFFLATKSNGLFISEKDPSGKPGNVVASLPLTGLVESMVRVGDYLFLACTKAGLQVVDISRPSAPALVKSMDFPGNIRDIIAVGRRLYLADDRQGLLTVDITLPDHPIQVEHFPLQHLAKLTIDDNYIYAASSETGLHIINNSTQDSLYQVGNIGIPWPLRHFAKLNHLSVNGTTAYLAAGPAGLLSFDITRPASPQLMDIIDLDGDIQAVTIDHSKILTTTRQGKLWVLQQEPDGKTSRRAVIDTLGIGHAIYPIEGWVFVANGIKGLTIIPLPQQIESSNHPGRKTLHIPPQATSGSYNLTLLSQGKLREFIGAVTLKGAIE